MEFAVREENIREWNSRHRQESLYPVGRKGGLFLRLPFQRPSNDQQRSVMPLGQSKDVAVRIVN